MRTHGCVKKLLFGSGIWLLLCVLNTPAQGGLTANPNSIDFGNQPAGTTTSPVSVTLTNNDVARTFTVVNVFSTAGPFAISGPSLPITLSPGQNLTVYVTFAPSAGQAFSGQFGFTTYYGWTIRVPLSGTGTQPPPTAVPSLLSVTSSALNFGDVNTGDVSVQTANLINSGNTNVTISSVSASGPAVTLTGIYAGLILAPGQTTAFTASFAPAAAGSVAGSVAIVSDAVNSSLVIPWNGTGSPSAHSVALSWTSSGSGGIIGYNVYRASVSGGPYSLLTLSPITATDYVDAGLNPAETLYYVVTSVGAGSLESAYSSQVSAAIP